MDSSESEIKSRLGYHTCALSQIAQVNHMCVACCLVLPFDGTQAPDTAMRYMASEDAEYVVISTCFFFSLCHTGVYLTLL
jgi:hypothetical protein